MDTGARILLTKPHHVTTVGMDSCRVIHVSPQGDVTDVKKAVLSSVSADQVNQLASGLRQLRDAVRIYVGITVT